MAHVQPQTQCTITGAAKERAEVEKKRREKKHLEFRVQIKVSIHETGTQENTLKIHLDSYSKTSCACSCSQGSQQRSAGAPFSMLGLGSCATFWRYDLWIQQHIASVMGDDAGTAASWEFLVPELYKFCITSELPPSAH